MLRTPIIAGNWKMHKNVPEAIEVSRKVEKLVMDSPVEVVICPPFTALPAIQALGLHKVKHGAQNMADEIEGAFTGEISVKMLGDLGCEYVIIGHSERRQLFGETNAKVNTKAKLALEWGISPIVCVGETLTERQEGQTEQVVVNQVKESLSGIVLDLAPLLVIAYEPVWAIGTGETATGEDANEVITTIRQTVADVFDPGVAAQIRIQYGGSVKPGNIGDFMTYEDIDGALVGGASLNPQDFSAIVRF